MNIKFHYFSFSFFKLSCEFKHKKNIPFLQQWKKDYAYCFYPCQQNRKNKILYEIPADTRFYFKVHAIQIQF